MRKISVTMAHRDSLRAGHQPLRAEHEPLRAGHEPLRAGHEPLSGGTPSPRYNRRSMRPLAFLIVAALASLACRSTEHSPAPSAKVAEPAAEPARPAAAPAPAAAPVAPRKFGAPLGASPALPLKAVLDKPDEFASRSVTVEARVRRNCTRRGCWMEIAESSDPSLPGCRVTFKDYGFFVPLDSAGSKARVEGTVEVQTVPPAQVAHLESEGAKFSGKQPDGSAREIRMVATGVELWREPG